MHALYGRRTFRQSRGQGAKFGLHTIALLLPLGLSLLTACGSEKPAPPVVRPAVVVQPQPDSDAVEVYAGVVKARHETALGFRVGGKLLERRVDIGDRVAAGQTLARLDPADLDLQAAAAEAQRAAAVADRALAQAQRDRYRDILRRGLASQADYDVRENAYRAAAARVGQLDAQLAVLRNQAEYAVLKADHAGVVTALQAEAGQVLQPGQPVLTLAREDELEIAIDLPEQRRDAFRPDHAAAIELWTRPGEHIAGTLREIAPGADPVTRTYAARVRFDAAAADARLGQTARVYFFRNGAAALAVPLSALHSRDGKPALWMFDPATQTVSLREVTIGPYREDSVSVLSGLGASEWIVVAGVHLLREGQRVMPVDRDNRRLTLTETAS